VRGVAKRRARPACPSPSTFTANLPLPSRIAWVGSEWLTQARTWIGSSESEHTAEAVIPAGPSGVAVVITVTPVAR